MFLRKRAHDAETRRITRGQLDSLFYELSSNAHVLSSERPGTDHWANLVRAGITEQRFNSRTAPREIFTYRRGFPLAGGTGARGSSIPPSLVGNSGSCRATPRPGC